MTDTFSEYLTKIDAQTDTLQQGLRLYLAEKTDDLPPDEMRVALLRTETQESVDAAANEFSADSELAEAAALAFLSLEWEDPARRPQIRGALENARRKLPVVEVAIVALVSMYAMYLTATGGRSAAKRTYRDKNGKFVEEEIKYASPGPWLDALLGILKRRR